MTVAFAALREKSSEYHKNKEGKASEKSLKSLVWDIKQLSELDEEGRKIMVNCLAFKEQVRDLVDKVIEEMTKRGMKVAGMSLA